MNWKTIKKPEPFDLALHGLVVTVIIAVIYGLQLGAMLESNKKVQQSFEASQRPFVSLGRKDGTLAEFVVPAPDLPDQNVGIKIYLQNGGQSAALTPNLGLLPLNLVLNGIGTGQSTPPKTPLQKNNFNHLVRTRDKNGGMGTSGGGSASIAPQSEYVYYFPDQISREQYDSMMKGQRALILTGICEYCDALGQYTCRQVQLFWQGAPFNAFSVVNEMDCAMFYGYAPIAVSGQKYLLPCEQPDEREAREKHERAELLKRAAEAPDATPATPFK